MTDLVDTVPADRWDRPTPCAGWTVRDLVNHLTAEHLWAPRLLAGESLADVGDAYDGDVLGEDPPATWRHAITRSLLAWADVEDEDAPVQVSAGRIPVREYADQMLLDLVVHAWDLAAALEEPHVPVAEAVHEASAYAQRELSPGQASPGVFAPAVPLPEGPTTALDRLVALLGRDPAWRP